ncbi:MAG: hypothetical protein GXN93_03255 [Candidatus Diapherotrites archaeon]|nr:hypothetical protein [Candidatus Diapherotrites archaeon]
MDVQIEPSGGVGEITVEVPFDGYRHLPRKSVTLLQQWQGEDVRQVQIGWLALGTPLNWEQDWEQMPGVDMLPVIMPVQTPGMILPQDWKSDRYRAVIRHAFETKEPRFWPVTLDFQVYDNEQALLELSEDQPDLLTENRLLSDIQLVWRLNLTVWLPEVLPLKRANVELERLQIFWPTVVSSQEMDIRYRVPAAKTDPEETSEVISVGDFPKASWRYAMESHSVEIYTLALHPGERKEGSPLVPYQVQVYFLFRLLGPVLSEDLLRGSFRLRIDGVLLSGRESAWFDATGRLRSGVLLEQCTLLEGRFEGFLSESFAFRRAAVYHRWYFSGVALTVTRLSQIASVLQDMGYQTRVNEVQEEKGLGYLQATQQIKDEDGVWQQVRFDIWVERLSKHTTTRRRKIPPDTEITTRFKVENLCIHCWVQSDRPGTLVSAEATRLQLALSDRLAVVAEVL